MEMFWAIFLFLIGACVGSFLNVVIWRLPRGQSIVFPGSHCPSCGRGIHWYDNIPLLSWLALKARCRYCKTSISPRYPLIELTTAILVGGLFVCYFILDLREQPTGPGPFAHAWPMYAAHAALLCGLLVCAAVDIEMWIVPLEVTWFIAIVGLVAAAVWPHQWMPAVSPLAVAISLAALAGLAVAMLLVRLGFIQRSFIDASDKTLVMPGKQAGEPGSKTTKTAPIAVAFTSACGVSPRKEILREALFLMPAGLMAVAAWAVLAHVPSVSAAWSALLNVTEHPQLATHLMSAGASVFGFLLAGLLVWGTRIVGTLGFGKEAMGMGDVHILAAVGAVTGWIVPLLAFFIAPLMGLLWAMYLLGRKNQRELPYGPWLAAATLLVMLFYDVLHEFVEGFARIGATLP